MNLRKRNFKHYTIALLMIGATLLGGCRSTAEYRRLSEAGLDYTIGMDQLLTAAKMIRINASSEQVLRTRSVQELQQLSEIDRDRIAILQNLRQHNQLGSASR